MSAFFRPVSKKVCVRCRLISLILTLCLFSTDSLSATVSVEQPGFFKHFLSYCGQKACYPNMFYKHCEYPAHPPRAYAVFNKYPPNTVFKIQAPLKPHMRYVCGSNAPIVTFCNGEILQLRVDMPQQIAQKTAITAFFGLAEASIFCPASFSTEPPSNKSSHSFIQGCKQRAPIRPGQPDRTFGDFGVEGDTWVLNLTLRESPGRYDLTMRTVSQVHYHDSKKIEFDETVNYNKQVESICCCSSGLELRIHDVEQSSFHSPATSIGDGHYNVTLHKAESFTALYINDTIHNEIVQSFATEPDVSDYILTLPTGIYQVSGEVIHSCKAEELHRPIRLFPANATLTIETLNMLERKLSWNMHSDLPVSHFEFYRQDTPQNKTTTHKQTLEFSVGGDDFDKPAPLLSTFVHRIIYEDIKDSDNPIETIPIDLSEFLPTNVTYVNSDTSTLLTWEPPESEADCVEVYQLTVGSTVKNPEGTFTIKPNGSTETEYFYQHYQYEPGEVVRMGLSAVFRLKTVKNEHSYWWGPVQPLLIGAAVSASTATAPPTTPPATYTPASAILTTTPSSVTTSVTVTTEPSSSASITPDADAREKPNLALILGGITGGLIIITTATAAAVFGDYFWRKKRGARYATFLNPLAAAKE